MAQTPQAQKVPGKLHEVLAAEKTVIAARTKLLEETRNKFSKPENFFSGHATTLKSTEDTTGKPQLLAMEREGSSQKAVPTNVKDTMEYFLKFWGKAEDLLYQKNLSNQSANADVYFRGAVLLENVPIDELMGLETRLTELRGLFTLIPTRDASKEWVPDENKGAGFYKTPAPDVSSKTAKTIDFITLAPATDKHPAQVKEFSKDIIVGSIEKVYFTGAATAAQKAELLDVTDELIVEVRQARQRANAIDAQTGTIADKISAVFLQALSS